MSNVSAKGNNMDYGTKTWERVDGYLKKVASQVKAAEEPSTSHPVGKADDGTTSASEGARSAENTKDVKAGVPASAEDAAKSVNETGAGGNPSKLTPTAKPTGEDPSNETGMAKTKADDPGTSHPAKAGSEKVAAADVIAAGDKLIAALAGVLEKVSAAAKPVEAAHEAKETPKVEKAEEAAEKKVEAAAVKTAEAKPAEKTEIEKAAEAGTAAADAAIAALNEKNGQELLASVVKQAQADAALLVDYMSGFIGQLNKSAEEEAGGETKEEAPAPKAPAAPEAPAGGAEAGGPAGGGEQEIQELVQAILESGISPEELIQALEQAEGAAGGGMPPAAGGMPPAGAAPEAPPMAAGPEAGAVIPAEAMKMAAAKKLSAVKTAGAFLKKAQAILIKEAQKAKGK